MDRSFHADECSVSADRLHMQSLKFGGCSEPQMMCSDAIFSFGVRNRFHIQMQQRLKRQLTSPPKLPLQMESRSRKPRKRPEARQSSLCHGRMPWGPQASGAIPRRSLSARKRRSGLLFPVLLERLGPDTVLWDFLSEVSAAVTWQGHGYCLFSSMRIAPGLVRQQDLFLTLAQFCLLMHLFALPPLLRTQHVLSVRSSKIWTVCPVPSRLSHPQWKC